MFLVLGSWFFGLRVRLAKRLHFFAVCELHIGPCREYKQLPREEKTAGR
jgi:hypothetical protein